LELCKRSANHSFAGGSGNKLLPLPLVEEGEKGEKGENNRDDIEKVTLE